MFRQYQEVGAAGIILLNTGLYSLPEGLFCQMVSHILTHQTKTIEFAYVFSQIGQSNGFDTIANFRGDFIGKVPEKVLPLKTKVFELVEEKMTEMIFSPDRGPSIPNLHPISFFEEQRIFYWNPGHLPDSRR